MNMFQKANGKDFAEQCAGVWWLANVNLTGKVREGTGTDKKKKAILTKQVQTFSVKIQMPGLS